MKHTALFRLLCVVGVSGVSFAHAQVAPQISLGIPQPVAGRPFQITLLAEGPADALPAAMGSFAIQWGDGTVSTTGPVANSSASSSHTYSTAGVYTVSASYSGDVNYTGGSVSQQVIALSSAAAPPQLFTFGDSLTYGIGDSSAAYSFPSVISAAEGWPLTNEGVSAYTALDTCAAINKASPLPVNSYTTLLVGQNDIRNAMPTAAGEAEYISAVSACSVWLATAQGTERITAASLAGTATGSWQPSPDFTGTGLTSNVTGSSLATQFNGNILYVQLTSVIAGAPGTVQVMVDGQVQGTYTPPQPAYLGSGAVYFAPYFVRIPLAGSRSLTHQVKLTCTSPGNGGCFVDWIAGNGGISKTSSPYLWLATPFLNNQNILPVSYYTRMAQDVRNIQTQLQADGLNVYLADVAQWFQGPSQTACMSDQIHPNNCGYAILAGTFLSSMDVLLANAPQVKLSTAGKHNFGYVADGLSEAYGVQIANQSGTGQPVTVQLAGPAEFTQTNNCPASLSAGSTCEIVFTYTPQASQAGLQTAQWSVAGSSAVITPQNGGTLLAQSEPTTALTLNTTRHNFGHASIGTPTSSFGLNIANPANVSFSGTLALSGAVTQFSVQNGCSLPLAAFTSCTVLVDFDPAVPGAQTMQLTITPSTGETVTPGNVVTFTGVGVQ